MKLRRSQLKGLIKECLREILEEDLTLELNVQPSALLRQQRPVSHQGINPLDEHSLRQRDEMIRESLQQRASAHGNQRQLPPALIQPDPLSLSTQESSSRYDRQDSGSRNPSDYIRMSQQGHQHRFDPTLDQPVAGQRRLPAQTQRRSQHQHQSEPEMASIPSPDVMREIYADTMQNTMTEQAAYGHVRPGHHNQGGGGEGLMPQVNTADPYAVAAAKTDPSEMAGSQDWAALAFA